MQSLLDEGLDYVKLTNLSRKLTIDGITKAYPVYRVRLDQLFYNDQNDRIATWISQYKSDHAIDTFDGMSRDSYNDIIERFIIQSNEAAIEKTQMNIRLVHQREPGVILSDGRVIDGNRRFTCLRRLAAEDNEFNWFETVILDTNIQTDKKQIKMLELMIQHGEEKKVDYNPIDRLVGVYQDIVETKLLTVSEYADSTNESEFDVKKRIDNAMILVEFLNYIHMPKQWHIARDYQVVSVITDLVPLLKKCTTIEMQQKVKNAIFTNIMMHTIGDSRKYIRNLNSMMDSGFFMPYIKEQEKIGEILRTDMDKTTFISKKDLDFFVSQHEESAENLQLSLDHSLLKAKKHEVRNRPSQIVSKGISLLKDVDTNILNKLTDSEKDNLKGQLNRLTSIVDNFDTIIDNRENGSKTQDRNTESITKFANSQNRFFIAKQHIDEPSVICLSTGTLITNFSVNLKFRVYEPTEGQKSDFEYEAFFLDNSNHIISDIQKIQFISGECCNKTFILSSEASSLSECLLALKSCNDAPDELQQLIPFIVTIGAEKYHYDL